MMKCIVTATNSDHMYMFVLPILKLVMPFSIILGFYIIPSETFVACDNTCMPLLTTINEESFSTIASHYDTSIHKQNTVIRSIDTPTLCSQQACVTCSISHSAVN